MKVPKKIYSTADISKISSYRVGARGVLSPLDILKLPKSYVVSYAKPSSYISAPVSMSRALPSYKSSMRSYVRSSARAVSSYLRTPSGYRGYGISYRGKPYRYGYGYGGRSYGYGGYTGVPPPPTTSLYKPLKFKKKEKGMMYHPVFLRRYGQFKIIGFGRTPPEAFSIGREAAAATLGATFRVPSYKGLAPKGFYTKYEKDMKIFIEKPEFRLSRKSEVSEIMAAKRRKK